jgi:hypothetical protein
VDVRNNARGCNRDIAYELVQFLIVGRGAILVFLLSRAELSASEDFGGQVFQASFGKQGRF